MNTQRTTHVVLVGLAGLAVLTTGCSAPAASATRPAPAAPAAPVVAPAAPAAPAAAEMPAAPAAAPEPTRPGTKAEAKPVDPARYFVESWGVPTGFYASSPTGNIRCAIIPGWDGGVEAGCTTTYQVKQLDCASDEGRLNAPIASFDAEGDLSFWCSGDGALFLVPSKGEATGGKVLPYGTSLTVGDYQLSSTRRGMVLSHADGTAVTINRPQGFVRTTVRPR